jgi:quercetin dioxygenase-like cupin family protein
MEGTAMGFPVYDYREDVRNVVVTPQIRSRFMRMEPGQVARRHSHDLGHEVFLVLAGRAEFEIEGETAELGPGQMCVVLADQLHSVRVVGDEPMTMYLSVTPHVQPTHTMWSEAGERLPPRFMPNGAYDLPEEATPIETLLDRHLTAAHSAAEAAQASAAAQQELAAQLQQATAAGDLDAAREARDRMWEAIYRTYQAVHDLASAWNALAPRCVER